MSYDKYKNLEEGYYKVKVQEFSGNPFWTVGLWKSNSWKFAEGDGDNFGGTGFTILEVDSVRLLEPRQYL